MVILELETFDNIWENSVEFRVNGTAPASGAFFASSLRAGDSSALTSTLEAAASRRSADTLESSLKLDESSVGEFEYSSDFGRLDTMDSLLVCVNENLRITLKELEYTYGERKGESVPFLFYRAERRFEYSHF